MIAQKQLRFKVSLTSEEITSTVTYATHHQIPLLFALPLLAKFHLISQQGFQGH